MYRIILVVTIRIKARVAVREVIFLMVICVITPLDPLRF